MKLNTKEKILRTKILAIPVLAFTLISSVAFGGEILQRHTMEVDVKIDSYDINKLNETGTLGLKRALRSSEGSALLQNLVLENVEVDAIAVESRRTDVTLEMGRREVDFHDFRYIAPRCIPIATVTPKPVVVNGVAVEDSPRKERECRMEPFRVQSTTLYARSSQQRGAWKIYTGENLRVKGMNVEGSIPGSYSVERNAVGKSKKAAKIVGSTRTVSIAPTLLDSVAVKSLTKSITIQGATVKFIDGTYKKIDMYGKLRKGHVMTGYVGRPFTEVVSVSVSAASRSLSGSRGKFQVYTDTILD